MDATGARELRKRLDGQEHWRQSDAVRRGEQSERDPDAADLEEMEDGLRLYSRREESRRMVDGSPALVVERLTKRLVDGRWEVSYEVERIRQL